MRPLALVTGASSGIGRELARQFADHGFDLVIAARHEDLLDVGEELQRSGVAVTPVQVDLATAAGVDELAARVRASGAPLAAAALNVGTAAGGAFAGGTELADDLHLVDLNVRGTVQLAHHVVADMAARGEGRILFTSSIASNMPGPYNAVYNASKSFVQAFALALRAELAHRGVHVTALMPGPTATGLFEKAGMGDTRVGSGAQDDPADVARMGYDALMEGRERVVASGLRPRVEALASRFVPDRVKAALHGVLARPGAAGD